MFTQKTTEGLLTKREIFILAAMQGILANPDIGDFGHDKISEWSICQADNLLEKLESESN